MDQILTGILVSDQTEAIKKSVLQKIAQRANSSQSEAEVKLVLAKTLETILNSDHRFNVDNCMEIYLTWGKHNRTIVEQLWQSSFLGKLLESNSKNGPNIIWTIHSTFNLLKNSSQLDNLSKLFKTQCINFVRENPSITVIVPLCKFLFDFKYCIPQGVQASNFCISLTHAISTFSLPMGNVEKIRSYIFDITVTIGQLFQYIWKNNDKECMMQNLRCIFKVISYEEDGGLEPSTSLAAIVECIPIEAMQGIIDATVSDSTIEDHKIMLSLCRMIDWLNWPTALSIYKWIVGFLKALAQVHKYSILISVTELKVTQVFQKITYALVRYGALKVLTHMLLSFQHSPHPFHKIAVDVPATIIICKRDSTPEGKKVLLDLVELLYTLMYLHGGYPDIYDTILESIKEFPKPSDTVMKSYLLKTKWTSNSSAHDNHLIMSRRSETGKTGLVNLGNTCYMNCVLQALYMCDNFREAVLHSTPSMRQFRLLKLQCVFTFLIHTQRVAYSPTTFLKLTRPSWFTAGHQQDCSEFLKHFFDSLLEEEKKSYSNSNNDTQNDEQNIDNNSSDDVISNNIIHEHFGGLMNIMYRCTYCGYQSNHKEFFTDIPLPLSLSQHNDISNIPEDKTVSLNDLLQSYLTKEELTGENMYYCDKCRSLRTGERLLKITKSPDVLILTLLRFSYDTDKQKRSKICSNIHYPKVIELPVYDNDSSSDIHEVPDDPNVISMPKSDVVNNCIVSEVSNLESKNNLSTNLCSDNDMSKRNCEIDNKVGIHVSTDKPSKPIVSSSIPKSSIYALSAVIVHSGISSESGHYYCYARHITSIDEAHLNDYRNSSNDDKKDYDFYKNEWYLFNDSRVTSSGYDSFSHVTERFNCDTAYVIFYHRVHPPNNNKNAASSCKKPKIANEKINLTSKWREMVNNDNQSYIKEQEQEKRNSATKYGNLTNHINRNRNNDDGDDDFSGGPPNCGGNGLGGFDPCGSRFIY